MKVFKDPQLRRWADGNKSALDSLAQFERLYFDGDNQDFINVHANVADTNDIRMRNDSIVVSEEAIKPRLNIYIAVKYSASLLSDVWDIVPELVAAYNEGKVAAFVQRSSVVVKNKVGGIPHAKGSETEYMVGVMPKIDFVFDADYSPSDIVSDLIRIRYANIPAMWYPESVPTQTTRDGLLRFQRVDQHGYKYVHDLEGAWHSSFMPTRYTMWLGRFMGKLVTGGTQKLAERMALHMLGNSFGLEVDGEIEATHS